MQNRAHRPTISSRRVVAEGLVQQRYTLKADVSQVGQALARIPSGCFILTVTTGERSTGMLVSWVQQAAFEPPVVSVCLKHGRPAVELVDAAQRFLIGVLGPDTATLFRHFGKGFPLEEDAFAGLATEPTEFGPLIGSCIAHLGCRVIRKVDVGDHSLYLAEVVAARVTGDSKPYVHVRRNGLSY